MIFILTYIMLQSWYLHVMHFFFTTIVDIINLYIYISFFLTRRTLIIYTRHLYTFFLLSTRQYFSSSRLQQSPHYSKYPYPDSFLYIYIHTTCGVMSSIWLDMKNDENLPLFIAHKYIYKYDTLCHWNDRWGFASHLHYMV